LILIDNFFLLAEWLFVEEFYEAHMRSSSIECNRGRRAGHARDDDAGTGVACTRRC
jgi:hypothetical protein